MLWPSSLCAAATIQSDGLRITALAQVKPYKLSRTKPSPIAVFVAGHLQSTTGGVPPQLRRLIIAGRELHEMGMAVSGRKLHHAPDRVRCRGQHGGDDHHVDRLGALQQRQCIGDRTQAQTLVTQLPDPLGRPCPFCPGNEHETPPELIPNLDDLATEDGKAVDNVYVEHSYGLLTDPLASSWPGPGEGRTYVVLANVGWFQTPGQPAVAPDLLLSLDVRWPAAPRCGFC